MIAALYVETGGVYYGLPDVDPWDEARDARRYGGPWPVVAHPPCARWSRLAGLVQARWGHEKGDDGGTFAAALGAVRQYSGVLEHPAYLAAWSAFRLPVPMRGGGWQRGICGGWTCHVEQAKYGHPARKGTWLYAYGTDLPELRWGRVSHTTALVSACANNTRPGESRRRIMHAEAARTPLEFRDTLIAIARSAQTVCPVSSSC